MKINNILIITSIHPDFDSRIWKLCTSLVKAGCEITLICPWNIPNGKVIEGVTLLTFSKKKSRFLRLVFTPFQILHYLIPIIGKTDLVHFHDIDILPFMALLSLLKPVVYDIHENYPEEMLVRYWVPKLLRRYLFHIVRVSQNLFCQILRNIVLVTPAQLKNFKTQSLNIFYLYNYASANLLSQINDNYFQRKDHVVFVGSCYESNGLSLFLKIARLSKSLMPNLEFSFPDRFGNNNSYRQQVVEYIDQHNLTNTSMFPNVLPHELMSILNTATIAIAPDLRTPNRSLAIPTKLFEFMAAGLPIVSSDLPYQSELFSAFKIGILAQPENPASFLEAIKELVHNRQYAYQLGINGRAAFSGKFNWEVQIPELIKYYQGIVK